MLRESEFSFSCRRCRSCCHHKGIQLNPYEIARLASAIGMGTTRFIAELTAEPGCYLRFRPDGACPFLGDDGCAVHADRPLVCRLYPLVRHLDEQGSERFSRLEPPQRCKALVARDGRVADYLESQGTGPFLAAADLYLAVVREALAFLRRGRPDGEPPDEKPDQEKDGESWRAWLDTDQMLERGWRPEWGRPPGETWSRMLVHIKMLRETIRTKAQEEDDGRDG